MIKRLGLSKMIMLLITFCVLISLIIGGIFVRTSQKSISSITTNTEKNVNMMDSTSKKGIALLSVKASIIKSFGLVHSNVIPIVNEPDAETRTIFAEIINGFLKETEDNIKKCSDACNAIKEGIEKYHLEWTNIKKTSIDNYNQKQAMSLVIEKLNPLFDKALTELDKELASTVKETETNLQQAADDMKASLVTATEDSKKTNNILILTTLLSGIIILVVGIIFQKAISKTLNYVTQTLIENVELTKEVTNKMLQNITKLTSVATEQAAAVHETVATVEHLGNMVESNARSAQQSHQVSEKTTTSASSGKNIVIDMSQIMHKINENNGAVIKSVDHMTQEFNRIIEVISEIGTKTKIINEIVFQTRLLSFNASVEAARAGEAGKGFAVVAEEVGNLAQTSGKAAQEITQMLDNSRKQVEDIVNKNKHQILSIVESGKKSAGEGSEMTKRCGGSLEEILNYATELQSMISQVSEASQKQAASLKEMQTVMNDLDSATQTNSSTAEEFSATMSELETQANQLDKLSIELDEIVSGSQFVNKKEAPSDPNHGEPGSTSGEHSTAA